MRSTVITIAALMLLGASAASKGEPFTCSPAKQPACLDKGAVICESNATCVGRDAICVDADTCDSNGLICKSKFDAAFAEVQDKVRKYNQLVDEFNDLKADLATLQQTKRNINDCLTFARTLSDAKSCSG